MLLRRRRARWLLAATSLCGLALGLLLGWSLLPASNDTPSTRTASTAVVPAPQPATPPAVARPAPAAARQPAAAPRPVPPPPPVPKAPKVAAWNAKIAPPPTPPGDDVVVRLQRTLAALGLYRVPVTGVVDQPTHYAINMLGNLGGHPPFTDAATSLAQAEADKRLVDVAVKDAGAYLIPPAAINALLVMRTERHRADYRVAILRLLEDGILTTRVRFTPSGLHIGTFIRAASGDCRVVAGTVSRHDYTAVMPEARYCRSGSSWIMAPAR